MHGCGFTLRASCGLYASDTLGVVPAENELLHHLRDAIDTESTVNDAIFVLVLISKALEVFLEQELDGIDSPRVVDRLLGRSKPKGQLSFHIELQRGKSSWCFSSLHLRKPPAMPVVKMVVRLFRQAKEQGGVLSGADVVSIMVHSVSTISQYVREYEKQSGEVIPRRGTIHDLGCAMSHKRHIWKTHVSRGITLKNSL